jgi:hypothetical protein
MCPEVEIHVFYDLTSNYVYFFFLEMKNHDVKLRVFIDIVEN